MARWWCCFKKKRIKKASFFFFLADPNVLIFGETPILHTDLASSNKLHIGTSRLILADHRAMGICLVFLFRVRVVAVNIHAPARWLLASNVSLHPPEEITISNKQGFLNDPGSCSFDWQNFSETYIYACSWWYYQNVKCHQKADVSRSNYPVSSNAWC